jgi:L-fuculose-phosphate aldolase
MLMAKEREKVVAYGRRLVSSGLTVGSGGNLSVLDAERRLIAITPSGVMYDYLCPDSVVVVDMEGRVVEGTLKPSSELDFHLGLYRGFPDAGAVVHAHSPYATTFACLRWEIPAVHYLIGLAGKKVPVAPYATYGTKELAANIVASMQGVQAVLLANHGLVVRGVSLEEAFNAAEETEFVARIYYQCKCLGEPVILPDREMDRVLESFKSYGQTVCLEEV